MVTTVTITGTGTPIQRSDRAGAGVLVRSGEVSLQFDAGRGTVMRLAGFGQPLTELDALFVTHHHSDHIVGIPDLVMTRWPNDIQRVGQPDLAIYAPDGEAADIIERMLDVWQDEITMRQQHTGRHDRDKGNAVAECLTTSRGRLAVTRGTRLCRGARHCQSR